MVISILLPTRFVNKFKMLPYIRPEELRIAEKSIFDFLATKECRIFRDTIEGYYKDGLNNFEVCDYIRLTVYASDEEVVDELKNDLLPKIVFDLHQKSICMMVDNMTYFIRA